MAKTAQKTSKSALIRAALKATPEKPVSEIAKDLGVKPGLIYNIKATDKKKNGAAPRKRRRGRTAQNAAVRGTAPKRAHDALDSAFEFVTRVGGLLHAEQLIAKLKALKERL